MGEGAKANITTERKREGSRKEEGIGLRLIRGLLMELTSRQ